MSYDIIKNELKLKQPVLGISRVWLKKPFEMAFKGCVYKHFCGIEEPIYFTAENVGCKGAAAGCGFSDALPDIPGGFGNFISQGAGEGFPPGERIKCSAQLAEKMFLAQPKNVMDGKNAIKIERMEEGVQPELVLFFATPDQLSGLIHLFYYRREDHDSVTVPVCSGCAQLFRLPFAELDRGTGRAVMGNIDFFSRPHMDRELLAFTVPYAAFAQMCEDAPECCFFAPAWKGMKKRL